MNLILVLTLRELLELFDEFVAVFDTIAAEKFYVR
jgi:hypothetical protein